MKPIYFFRLRQLLYAGFLLIAFLPVGLHAQAPDVLLKPVITSGLSQPMQVVHAGDGTQRLFVVQKGGSIKVFDRVSDELFTDRGTFMAITGILTSGEQGLLSMAFDPAYATNGFFYLYYTNGAGNLELARYHVGADPYRGDSTTKLTLLQIPHPGQANHNGGELHFGSDGFLYLSTGDGGGSGDPNNNAQNTSSLLGKLLRINVAGATAGSPFQIPAGNPFGNPVYALGLRNPFRWSFDRQTGDIWIGDVGQGAREEVDFVAAGGIGGANFGWRCYEGDLAYNTAGCAPQNTYVSPAYTYPNPAQGQSVIGGVVYRGNGFPALQGYYIGTDHYSQNLQVISRSGGTFSVALQAAGVGSTSDFGESENGELYASNLGNNTIYRVTVDPGPLPVTLTVFTAAPEEGGVRLSWQTASEKASERFDIQHSLNSRSWADIGTVPAAGESNGMRHYTFRHDGPAAGVNYYRLRTVDTDGSAAFSPVRNVVLDRPFSLAVYPNPSAGGILYLKSPELTSVHSVEVISPAGLTVLRTEGAPRLDTRSLATGVYLLKITRLTGEVISRRVSILR